MQTVVDTYGSFAFGYLHMGKLPDHAALILHNDALPFYENHGFNIEAILTNNGREYCTRLTHHHYEIYLELKGIEHRKTCIATPKTNGFSERFNRAVKEEFFDIALRQKLYTSCMVPWYNGTKPSNEEKEKLWDKYYTEAPERQRQPAEQYKIVKRA